MDPPICIDTNLQTKANLMGIQTFWWFLQTSWWDVLVGSSETPNFMVEQFGWLKKSKMFF